MIPEGAVVDAAEETAVVVIGLPKLSEEAAPVKPVPEVADVDVLPKVSPVPCEEAVLVPKLSPVVGAVERPVAGVDVVPKLIPEVAAADVVAAKPDTGWTVAVDEVGAPKLRPVEAEVVAPKLSPVDVVVVAPKLKPVVAGVPKLNPVDGWLVVAPISEVAADTGAPKLRPEGWLVAAEAPKLRPVDGCAVDDGAPKLSPVCGWLAGVVPKLRPVPDVG